MRRLTNIFFVVLLTQIHPSKPSVRNDNIRPTRSTIYREEFETYETVQREQQQRKDDGGARRTRMRYMEFAETEFSRRPSRLLPVQFIGTMDRQNQVGGMANLIVHNRAYGILLKGTVRKNSQPVDQATNCCPESVCFMSINKGLAILIAFQNEPNGATKLGLFASKIII